MSSLDMFHAKEAYERRMLEIMEDEKNAKMRVVVSHLSERFAGIGNFEELKSKAISYLKKIASGEIRVSDSILYPLVEIEMALSRDIPKEEQEEEI